MWDGTGLWRKLKSAEQIKLVTRINNNSLQNYSQLAMLFSLEYIPNQVYNKTLLMLTTTGSFKFAYLILLATGLTSLLFGLIPILFFAHPASSFIFLSTKLLYLTIHYRQKKKNHLFAALVFTIFKKKREEVTLLIKLPGLEPEQVDQ